MSNLNFERIKHQFFVWYWGCILQKSKWVPLFYQNSWVYADTQFPLEDAIFEWPPLNVGYSGLEDHSRLMFGNSGDFRGPLTQPFLELGQWVSPQFGDQK